MKVFLLLAIIIASLIKCEGGNRKSGKDVEPKKAAKPNNVGPLKPDDKTNAENLQVS